MPIAYTRAMIAAALDGGLAGVPTTPDPVFGVHVPERCPGVPSEILQPRSAWKDPEAYDQQARRLAEMFQRNFEPFAGLVSAEVREAGPRVG